MGTWKTRGLRGSALEDLLNLTNDIYRTSRLALVQKIPTPITPMEFDKESRHITLAYFDKISTVDYWRMSMSTRSASWRSFSSRTASRS